MNVLVTGAAGFIGYHLCQYLLARGDSVVGIDNLNDYYDVNLKQARLRELKRGLGCDRFRFIKMDIADKTALEALFQEGGFSRVVNLAAQAGVRYSLENPDAYISSNIVGFMNVLEGCRHQGIEHLVYASSSSVYGANESLPFSEHDNVDHPLSLYAATKKSNELMAHTYSSLYQLPTTGLRFFTVYGPWGRPDMALFLFTRNILAGEPIDVFNHGHHRRDFTYIDDIVEGVVRSLDDVAVADAGWKGLSPDPATSFAPWRVFNIGHGEPVELMTYIRTIEQVVGRKAQINFQPMQPGDVPETAANVDALEAAVRYRPGTDVEEGVERFVRWYRNFYSV
ncbi:NAD-dependent epimerase [Aestuariirhabdus sp. LZHN29]|uniref:NAD-dependent epimerase n=1 Tax=Aestuariirhabdus sp. LZHN29 TaxID=3417462 RepID=UPI003CE91F50